MGVPDFIDLIASIHSRGNATEHSYRAALGALLESMDPDITVTNEPRRTAVGAPDFVIARKGVPIGWVEAKDLGVSIRPTGGRNKEQQTRYRAGFTNLVYTDGIAWDFYVEGNRVESVVIAELGETLIPRPGAFATLEHLLQAFVSKRPQTIGSPAVLARMMAGKTTLMKDALYRTLKEDVEGNSDLAGQHKAFRRHLIEDISAEEFADVYAETIAYGMFAARLNDTTPEDFSRQEALALLPRTNPFLRRLFTYIAGPDLDDRLVWIADELARVFQATDIKTVVRKMGSRTGKRDPFISFYEDFLTAYNPKKRKARGVWYTPEPVVNFIIRAVDDILVQDFGLQDGLADIEKIPVRWDTGEKTRRGRVFQERRVHRVQLLDPATGTGTFLAEAIRLIGDRVKATVPGHWSRYVEQDLVPRIHGFELLMAAYSMCHVKLAMVLKELGYEASEAPPRMSVYLTNSLEKAEREAPDLFMARWLTDEAHAASQVKRNSPIMCIVGNPPYNPSSLNNSPWIMSKVADYRKGLTERKVNISDDYIKFIRLAEHYIKKNKSGVVGMVTNNSFLDGTTQRTMRKHLMKTFDSIYVLNLHGDIRSGQRGADQNVFDITQGVAIVLFVRKARGGATRVFYRELLGPRSEKYATLFEMTRQDLESTVLEPAAPNHLFVPRAVQSLPSSFALEDFFRVKSSGIQTKNDAVAIQWTEEERDVVLQDFQTLPREQLEKKYPSKKVWSTTAARADVLTGDIEERRITYRPFDHRYTLLTRKSNGFLGRPRYKVMQHIAEGDLCLIVNNKFVGESFSHVSVCNSIACHGVHYLGNRGQDYVCPVYLKDDGFGHRPLNYDPDIHERLCRTAARAGKEVNEFDVFDYIYGVLHCVEYRRLYIEQLKVGFPPIPWPADAHDFWQVAEIGRELRELHLFSAERIGPTPYPFEGTGDSVVREYTLEGECIKINDGQYFSGVQREIWNTRVGGYEPAQKWLKDRLGRELGYADIRTFQRILKILLRTHQLSHSISMSR